MVPLCSYSYNHRAIEELYSLSSHHFPLRIWLVWLKAPLCMFGRVGSSSPFVRCTTTNCVPQRLLTRWDFLVCAFFSCFPSLIFFFWGGVGSVGLQRVQLTCYWVRLGKKGYWKRSTSDIICSKMGVHAIFREINQCPCYFASSISFLEWDVYVVNSLKKISSCPLFVYLFFHTNKKRRTCFFFWLTSPK